MINIDILDEFERLDSYSKAICLHALYYSEHGSFELNDECIAFLAFSLNIDYEILKKYLTYKNNDALIFLMRKYYVNIDSTFFDIMSRIYYIRKGLEEIKLDDSEQHLYENRELIFSILHHFEMINIRSATFECMSRNTFSTQYTIYSGKDFAPRNLYDILNLFLTYKEYYNKNKKILPIIYQLITYELYTRTNTLHLISTVQMIKTSVFFQIQTRQIAEDLYENLLFMLNNAKVISIQINMLYQNLDTDCENRFRERDNTTRLQILYGYDNYDAYSVRLDLAHQGVGWVHYNNSSPGGIKSYLFSKEEHDSAIKRFPALKNCFIQYDKRWALKEKINCNLTDEGEKAYEIIENEKSHQRVFNDTYTEQNIVNFIDLIAKMFPAYYKVPIDKEEEHSKYCFNYDKIMEGLTYYYLFYFSSESKCQVKDFLLTRAINYGLIKDHERNEYNSIEGMFMIAELAKDRLNIKYLY